MGAMRAAWVAVAVAAAAWGAPAAARTVLQYGSSTSYVYRVNSGNGGYSGQSGVFQNGGGNYANQGSGSSSSGGGGSGLRSGPGTGSGAGDGSSVGVGDAYPTSSGGGGGGGGGDDWGSAAAAAGPMAAPAPSGPPFNIPVQPQLSGYVLGMGLELKNKWDFPCPRETLSSANGSDGAGECKLAGTPKALAAECDSHSICKGFAYFPNGQSFNHTAVAWMKGGTSPRDGPFDPTKVDLNPNAALYIKKSAIPSNNSTGSSSSGGGNGSGSSGGSGSGGSGNGGGGSGSGGSGSGGSGSGGSGSGSSGSGSSGSGSSGSGSSGSGSSGSGSSGSGSSGGGNGSGSGGDDGGSPWGAGS